MKTTANTNSYSHTGTATKTKTSAGIGMLNSRETPVKPNSTLPPTKKIPAYYHRVAPKHKSYIPFCAIVATISDR